MSPSFTDLMNEGNTYQLKFFGSMVVLVSSVHVEIQVYQKEIPFYHVEIRPYLEWLEFVPRSYLI